MDLQNEDVERALQLKKEEEDRRKQEALRKEEEKRRQWEASWLYQLWLQWQALTTKPDYAEPGDIEGVCPSCKQFSSDRAPPHDPEADEHSPFFICEADWVRCRQVICKTCARPGNLCDIHAAELVQRYR